jgi:Uncharacterized conserved protein
MKRSYYIVPIVLLVLFGFVYWQHQGEMNQKIEAQKAEEARIRAEEEAKKAEAERKAREDAERRMAEREEAERKKEEDRIAKRKAEIERINSDIERFTKQLADNNKEAASLEKQLASLRAEKEQLGRDSFDLSKKIALAHANKRTAEIEVQRMAQMVAKRASESTLTQMPTPPAQPTRK